MTIEKTATRDVVRVLNKHVLNPVLGQLAGRKRFYASSIHHTGRRSGKSYDTPVVAHRVTDGFVIALPYGTRVDWLQNLSANGAGRLRYHGQDFAVTAPRVVEAATALAELPPSRRRVLQRMGIGHFVHLNLTTT